MKARKVFDILVAVGVRPSDAHVDNKQVGWQRVFSWARRLRDTGFGRLPFNWERNYECI
jgi:hypothetical protein